MTNLKKIGLTALAGSLAAIGYAQAGSLSVGGTARMEVQSNQVTTAAGVETETDAFSNNGTLTFSGSGELDNGFTASYYQALADGTLTSSNAKLDMGDMGVIGMGDHNHAGVGTIQDIVPNGGEQPWDDIGAVHGGHEDGVANPHTGDRLGYTTASDIVVSVAADLSADGGTQSIAISNSTMVDGLKIVAGYADVQSTQALEDDLVTYGLSYTMGSISVGAQKTKIDAEAANSDIERDAFGISFAVNENLSIGMGVSDVEYDALGNDEESREIGAVYTSGGMTFGFQNITKDNIAGTAVDHEMNELQLTLAF
ncbi:porin [Candidatus Pelagibacter sp.]|nr:porin [Candidatus Pelagibacter sp.]